MANLFQDLIQQADMYVPELAPSKVAPPAVPMDNTAEEFQLTVERMKVFSKEMPFDKYQMRTILKNMAIHEAITAPKASDRIAALTLIGKSASVDYFAADKVEVTHKTPEALRDAIAQRLEKLFGSEAIEAEFTEVGRGL